MDPVLTHGPWRRWQDYATIVLGALLFLSPIAFADTGQSTATLTAYILGVLLILSGLLAAAMRQPYPAEYLPLILGAVTFVSPWIFGFSTVTGIAWTSWIVGVLTVVNAGSLLLPRARGMRPV
jgi:uncharacterized membrane protein HdeD (DUF308 family)